MACKTGSLCPAQAASAPVCRRTLCDPPGARLLRAGSHTLAFGPVGADRHRRRKSCEQHSPDCTHRPAAVGQRQRSSPERDAQATLAIRKVVCIDLVDAVVDQLRLLPAVAALRRAAGKRSTAGSHEFVVTDSACELRCMWDTGSTVCQDCSSATEVRAATLHFCCSDSVRRWRSDFL